MDNSFWDKRYADVDSVYGYNPNEFFKDQIQKLTPGKLLLPGEGEGRNALYAATLGWKVTAIDFSEVAKEKTLGLARLKGLSIDYQLGDLGSIHFPKESYDLVALIYVHLPENKRKHLLSESINALKVGGKILLEVFSKEQINYTSGGPKDLKLLYSLDELMGDLKGIDFQVKDLKQINLDEGDFHRGAGSVVRVVASKS